MISKPFSKMITGVKINGHVKLVFLSLIALAFDYIWLINNQESAPGWDQGYHLSNTFKMYNILDYKDLSLINKLSLIFEVTDNYRGPLTYLLSALVLKVFNNSYIVTYLSNNLFNFITICSIYNICKLFNLRTVGIWASLIFTFSPLIFHQRTDYLIDSSLTAFSMLCLATLTYWLLSKKIFSNFAIFSGISYGLIFLIKPTGIVFFIIPLATLFINKYKKIGKPKIETLKEIISFIIFSLLTIFPWFSKHWLTIISSTINAWNWGIKYQDGLDLNTVEGWIYYFKEIPFILGISSFILLLIFFIFELISKNNFLNPLKNINKKMNIWLFLYLVNGFLILSLMSTKDPRFIMPIYPILCVYFSLIINQNTKKGISKVIKKNLISISLLTTLLLKINLINIKLLSSNYNNFSDIWFHKEIIKEIKEENPLIKQTLAVLPDTGEINTFNIEAEAIKQGENVSVRQIISNEKNYKDDLKYFDWFLLKTGDQGIMNNKSKKKLNIYLKNNNSFVKHKEWILPDKSKLILMRRNKLNSYISEIECKNMKKSYDINLTNNKFIVNIDDIGKNINNAILLVDVIGDNTKTELNIALLNGKLYKILDPKKCYQLTQFIPANKEHHQTNSNLVIQSKLLTSQGRTINFVKKDSSFEINLDQNKNDVLFSNKIHDVENLGFLIKDGKFDELFYLVGILNQSDPSQIYLKQSERIFSKRYKENKELKNLYSILISQILQKEAKKAQNTVNKILLLDKSNGNTYFTKSIIELYLLNFQKAKKTLEIASNQNIKSNEVEKLIKDIKKVLNKL